MDSGMSDKINGLLNLSLST